MISTPAELDSAWASLVDRVKKLEAPAAALQPLYAAYAQWSVALSSGAVTAATFAQWLSAFDANSTSVVAMEGTYTKKVSVWAWAIGVGVVIGGFVWLNRPVR